MIPDRIRIGLRIPPCAPAPVLADLAAQAERAGFDEVWFPDSQLLWRDVFAVAASAAQATTRIGLGTAVTNVLTRHPSVLASAARTVGELAPGRFVLGVGVGDSAVSTVGLRPATGAQLREHLRTVRELLAGKTVEFGGAASRLRDPGPDVPIYLAASGPRNLRLAGELADGAILLSGVAPDALAAATARVREGAQAAAQGAQGAQGTEDAQEAEEADRQAEPRPGQDRVPMTVSAFCRVTDDVPRDARELKPICARIAQNGGASFLALAGVHVEVPEHVPGIYPDLVHAENWSAAVAACADYVSDEAAAAFARRFCLYGTPSEIARQLADVHAAGADAVCLQHVGSYDLPEALLTDVANHLLPTRNPASR
jgi:5,10-methylenetetrahydromethanopterin reductase